MLLPRKVGPQVKSFRIRLFPLRDLDAMKYISAHHEGYSR